MTPSKPLPDVGVRALRHHVNEFLDDASALALEDSLWWYVGRRAILRRYLERAARERPLTPIGAQRTT